MKKNEKAATLTATLASGNNVTHIGEPHTGKQTINIIYENRRDELMSLPMGKYKAVVDLKKDIVIVTNARMRKGWLKIADICIVKDTKKACEDAAREVKQAVTNLKKVCKSSLIKAFGRKVADKAPVWACVDNPHYSYSEPMKLYLAASMEYLYGTGKLETVEHNANEIN